MAKKTNGIDDKRAIDNLMTFLGIEGLSGRERKVAREVRHKARAAGCKKSWIAFDEANRSIPGDYEIGNLIVQLPGTVDGPRRLFSGHMDTVPLCRGAEPVRKGGRIVAKGKTGLGGDNRTAVACLVTVLETVLEQDLPHPPLTFLFTVGEEVGLWGARFVKAADLGRPKPTLGFNIDGPEPNMLAIGALGADRWEVEVIGRSAHAGAYPDHGVSSTLIAANAIQAVAAKGYFGKIRKGRRTGTANVGVLRGGEATNQITDHIFAKGESRSHDPKFVDEITAAWRKGFERAAHAVKNKQGVRGKIRFRCERDYRPFLIDRKAPVVTEAVGAMKRLGLRPKLLAVDGGLDANYFNERGIPTVTLGAGQHAPHTVDEYVEVREYLTGCRLALALATATA